MSDAAGRQLQAELTQHATQASFVYKHEWQSGDVVMWDNGFVLHRRDPYEASQNRLLKRTTMQLSPLRHIIPGSSGRVTSASGTDLGEEEPALPGCPPALKS